MKLPRLVRDAEHAEADPRGLVVVIGNFDGVHRGHQQVLARARATAAERGLGLAILTFEPHPAAVLGASAPPRLTRLTTKVELVGRLGVDLVVAQHFDDAFAALSPRAFVERCLVGGLCARVVVVGHDFRFGARRAGDLDALRAFGAEKGFTVDVQEVVGDELGPFSSTRVRAALAAGDLGAARHVLGRPHAIEGVVVAGDKRGRTLGFPTANLDDVEEAFPLNGVYAVLADRSRAASSTGASPPAAFARGVANVGLRPSVRRHDGGGGHPSIEVHLFDLAEADRDLYGDTLRIHFVERLREERRFPGLDALKAQIAEDATRARQITGIHPFPARGGF